MNEHSVKKIDSKVEKKKKFSIILYGTKDYIMTCRNSKL